MDHSVIVLYSNLDEKALPPLGETKKKPRHPHELADMFNMVVHCGKEPGQGALEKQWLEVGKKGENYQKKGARKALLCQPLNGKDQNLSGQGRS